MPLRDHFRSPLNDVHSWDELHGGWPMLPIWLAENWAISLDIEASYEECCQILRIR
jgi:hypothetical protein